MARNLSYRNDAGRPGYREIYAESKNRAIPLDSITASRYYPFMIKSFKSKETEKVFHRDFSRKFPHNIQKTAYRRLAFLHSAKELKDLLIPPSNRLEKLSGNRKGWHSIRINDQWRICFQWQDGDAYEVEIIDYH